MAIRPLTDIVVVVIIENDADTLILTAEAAFKSPPGAAVVIEGCRVNGLRAWKPDGKTLAEWEAEEQVCKNDEANCTLYSNRGYLEQIKR